MALRTIFFYSLMTGFAWAESWRPDDRLLDAIRFVESSNGRFPHGDNGRSLGDFQLSEAAWIDVSAWRKEQGLQTFDYEQEVFNPKTNRLYAADYLTILQGQLARKLDRPPTTAELYAAYNLGMAGFARSDYQLARVNSLTARKSRLVQFLESESESEE